MTILETVTEQRCEALTIGDIPPYRCATSATVDRRGGRSVPTMLVPCAYTGLKMPAISERDKSVRCEAIAAQPGKAKSRLAPLRGTTTIASVRPRSSSLQRAS
jgi:hypothetical protein